MEEYKGSYFSPIMPRGVSLPEKKNTGKIVKSLGVKIVHFSDSKLHFYLCAPYQQF